MTLWLHKFNFILRWPLKHGLSLTTVMWSQSCWSPHCEAYDQPRQQFNHLQYTILGFWWVHLLYGGMRWTDFEKHSSWPCDHVYIFRRIIISMISVCKIWDSWGWTSSQNWYNLNIAGRRFFCKVGAMWEYLDLQSKLFKVPKIFSSKELVPKHDFRLDSQTSNFCSIARPNRFFRKGSGHETSMLWHVLLNTDINYRSLLQNYSLCKMVVIFMFRVEVSATEIKIEPSNQNSFWEPIKRSM